MSCLENAESASRLLPPAPCGLVCCWTEVIGPGGETNTENEVGLSLYSTFFLCCCFTWWLQWRWVSSWSLCCKNKLLKCNKSLMFNMQSWWNMGLEVACTLGKRIGWNGPQKISFSFSNSLWREPFCLQTAQGWSSLCCGCCSVPKVCCVTVINSLGHSELICCSDLHKLPAEWRQSPAWSAPSAVCWHCHWGYRLIEISSVVGKAETMALRWN